MTPTFSPSPLLAALCSVCGAPVVRHRTAAGRWIGCAAVRRLDEALYANGQPSAQPPRAVQISQGGRELLRQDEV